MSAKARANRRNATASTGPKTALGKKRASINARRHGLSTPISRVPALQLAVDQLTQRLLSLDGRSSRAGEATRIAESHVEFLRIGDARRTIIEQARLGEKVANCGRAERGASTAEIEILRNILKELTRIERYERRAVSRCKTAMRRLEDV